MANYAEKFNQSILKSAEGVEDSGDTEAADEVEDADEISEEVAEEVEIAISQLQQCYNLSPEEENILQKFLTILFTAAKKDLPVDRAYIDDLTKDFERECGDAITDDLYEIFWNYRNNYPFYLENAEAE